MSIWLTADTHFGHANIIRHCNRPFVDAHEMNKTMTERWNEVVKPEDTVYHLGDFAWGDNPQTYCEYLNGKIVLIKGNHDKDVVHTTVGIKQVTDLLVITLAKRSTVLCHYGMRVWPGSNRGAWHLYGHSHGKLSPLGLSFDVGVDAHNFYPWSEDEIAERMQQMKTAHTVADVLERRP